MKGIDHIHHIEDELFYGKYWIPINIMYSIVEDKSFDLLISTKWDGSPSIFAGIDPSDNKFFVAKKGIFNENPEIYKSEKDIDNFISDEHLNKKMKLSLKYLPELNIKGIIQGDFLYVDEDLLDIEHEGVEYVAFHPNTIMYAVSKDKPNYKRIKKSKLGIAWHTSYKGDSFDTLEFTPGVDINTLNNTEDVWSIDTRHKSIPFTSNQREIIRGYYEELYQFFKKNHQEYHQFLNSMPRLFAKEVEIFRNKNIKNGKEIDCPRRHTHSLRVFFEERYGKEIEKRKSEAGKEKQKGILKERIEFIEKNEELLINIFEVQKHIILVKLNIINKLCSCLNIVKPLIVTEEKIIESDHEGFIVNNAFGGAAVKLVDRLNFSYNNFSPNILKGWNKPKR